MENPPKRMDDLEVPQPLGNLHEGLPSAGGPVGEVQQVFRGETWSFFDVSTRKM